MDFAPPALYCARFPGIRPPNTRSKSYGLKEIFPVSLFFRSKHLLSVMIVASVVLAAFLYQTAMRDEMMPRKPLLSQMKLVAEKPGAPAAAPPKANKVKKTKGKS